MLVGMTTTAERATEALNGHLRPGERVIAATKAQLEGGTVRVAGAFAVGGVATAGILGTPGEDADIDRRLARGAAVAVTDQRVVVFDVTAMGANPKDPVLVVDRDRVTGIVSGTKRIMMIKVPTFGFTVTGDDGTTSELRFEVAKVQTGDANAVIAALGS